jgi:hypothetical protein
MIAIKVRRHVKSLEVLWTKHKINLIKVQILSTKFIVHHEGQYSTKLSLFINLLKK